MSEPVRGEIEAIGLLMRIPELRLLESYDATPLPRRIQRFIAGASVEQLRKLCVESVKAQISAAHEVDDG